MKLLFNIGGIGIHLFGITMALGIVAGLYIVVREVKRKGLELEKTFDLAFYTIIVGVVGARLNYILAFNPSFYFNNPKEIFMIQNGGLSIQGALIAGIVFAIWYMKRNGMPVWKTADAFAPGIILGQGIGRVGCDVFGIPMTGQWFWGINIGGQLLHPAQMYEAILNYILFLILWSKRKNTRYNGQLFVMYFIGFSMNRFIVEFFRENPLVIGRLSVAHVYSLIFIAVAILLDRFLQNLSQKTQTSVANDTTQEKKKIEQNKEFLLSIITIGILTILSLFIYYNVHL
ncbi:prolipoprotein diacylglyceryl transferase [Alkalicella caledoniensis]|uniref:Phosphatidylglycerol--prolipoprotein diacylglyceryl transferase n=1 Tax=Alkalicella caledoniensis TaxID=2731377 RepID=A0A7G9WBK7_ALKCA|nr:prolipoprotein diacylglyceryl transferase [Alkalicella caledoniensis]QNO16069.1 prolipoprotein diacylglyceryl transferase [Alkalicella caledoniensis]